VSRKKIIFICIAAVIAVWNSTYKLDVQPMFLWDESRQANNALEMLESGNVKYTTYENQPDFWNTKPHLLVFLQWIFFKILGPGLLALRLPSALAIAATVIIWMVFFLRKNLWVSAILFLLIAFCSRGLNIYHVGRTGDYDALLTLFLSIAFLQLYTLLFENGNKKNKIIFSIAVGMALLTKSFAAAIWMPIFAALYFVFTKDKKLRITGMVLPLLIPILGVIPYYLLHEYWTPGYLNAVFENEVLGRYFQQNEGHETRWYYYFSELFSNYFEGFILVIIPAYFLMKKVDPQKEKSIRFFWILILLFLTILSISATRIHWYMAPVIPVFCAILAWYCGVSLQAQNKNLKYAAWGLNMILLGICFWQFPKLWKDNLSAEGVRPQYVLQQAELKGKMPYTGYWMFENYKAIENYYSGIFRRKNLAFRITDKFHFHAKDTVMVYHYNQLDSIGKYYECRQLAAPDNDLPIWVMVIDRPKL